jgi:hypothetical protein
MSFGDLFLASVVAIDTIAVGGAIWDTYRRRRIRALDLEQPERSRLGITKEGK